MGINTPKGGAMTGLWSKLLEKFFIRVWFPKIKWKKDRISEAMIEMAQEEAKETKAPERKGQRLTL
jgi:hypothetical protein